MDGYPDNLRPKGFDTWEVEPFTNWWERVGHNLPNVPKNVARQWVWKHWDCSPYGNLPSGGMSFILDEWSNDRLNSIQVPGEDGKSLEEWGEYLVDLGLKNREYRYKLANIMWKKGVWPCPPIVLQNTEQLDLPDLAHCPGGYVLIEGHRRLAIAYYLKGKKRLASRFNIWLMRISEG